MLQQFGGDRVLGGPEGRKAAQPGGQRGPAATVDRKVRGGADGVDLVGEQHLKQISMHLLTRWRTPSTHQHPPTTVPPAASTSCARATSARGGLRHPQRQSALPGQGRESG